MRCIFVDNFRGFKETLLPIKDVNFFVGENSTGKTSLLALLHLFHSPHLWFGGQFSDEEIELGNYEDIVSMHAKDKKYFHIGALFGFEEGNKNEYDAFLMTFSESDGMPRIKRYTIITENKKAEVKFKGKRAFYKIGKAESITGDYSSARELFMQWVNSHKKEERGFSELKIVKSSRNIALINSLIKAIIKEESVSGKEITFSWPSFYSNLIWLAPIRTKSQPIYMKYGTPFSSEGHHTPYSIKRLLETKGKAEEFKRFVEAFGRESGLFDSVDIKKYGRRKVAPFEVDIILSGQSAKITNVGYGVSQVLPIIVELFEEHKRSAYMIQQPEIHLHPRAQAALGDVLFNLTVLEKKQFIVETHSDFIIDRFRMNYRKKRQKEKPESQIIYFENSSDGNVLNVIDIAEDGSLPKEQPRGYREFFLKEDLDVLGY